MTSWEDLRAEMVSRQLAARGIGDRRVLAAMGAVPREAFVPERSREAAYADAALGLSEGQTISQPWIVAAICQALELSAGDTVLEIGTGSGYSAAVLARLAGPVVSIERLAGLAAAAAQTLRELGIGSVEVRTGDGTLGAPDLAPFDAIAVHAAAPAPPPALLGQLAPGGRMVLPLVEGNHETLTLIRRRDEGGPGVPAEFERSEIAGCRFVPLLGEQGFPEPGR